LGDLLYRLAHALFLRHDRVICLGHTRAAWLETGRDTMLGGCSSDHVPASDVGMSRMTTPRGSARITFSHGMAAWPRTRVPERRAGGDVEDDVADGGESTDRGEDP
jgi:hypothetical protein